MRVNKIQHREIEIFTDFCTNALADTILGKNLKVNYLVLKALIIKCNAQIQHTATNGDYIKNRQLTGIGYNLYLLKDEIEKRALEIEERHN